MSEANFQTVKLTKGSHRTPDEGVCVMELTSMLAGEPFGDHPRSACPVIGSFLRTYNDRIGDGRRQDLYELAESDRRSLSGPPTNGPPRRRTAAG
jgi:hypothetical protein